VIRTREQQGVKTDELSPKSSVRSPGDGNPALSPKSSTLSPNVVSRFEDLIAWQKARELTRQIYTVTATASFSHDYGLKDQIRRASVSVMSNLAEGFDRGSRADFHRFIVIAKGSCAEVRAQLYVALDAGYISKEKFTQLYEMVKEEARIIAGLRKSVEKQRDSK